MLQHYGSFQYHWERAKLYRNFSMQLIAALVFC